MSNLNQNDARNISAGQSFKPGVEQPAPGRPGREPTKAEIMEKEKLNAAAGGEFKRVKIDASNQKVEPVSSGKLADAAGGGKAVAAKGDSLGKVDVLDAGKLEKAAGGKAVAAKGESLGKVEVLDAGKLEKAAGGFKSNEIKVETKVGAVKHAEKVDASSLGKVSGGKSVNTGIGESSAGTGGDGSVQSTGKSVNTTNL